MLGEDQRFAVRAGPPLIRRGVSHTRVRHPATAYAFAGFRYVMTNGVNVAGRRSWSVLVVLAVSSSGRLRCRQSLVTERSS